MTARWHVNPETGKPGRCKAAYACRFGGAESGHGDTMESASRLYEGFRDGLYDSNKSAHFYFMTDDEQTSFTEGDCGLLARELHFRTDYPVQAIGVKTHGKDRIEWEHVAVKTPEGRYMDVTGIHPEDSFSKTWSKRSKLSKNEEIVFEEIPEKSIEAYLGGDEDDQTFSDTDPKKAAAKILKAMK